jgi:hypothetical protein
MPQAVAALRGGRWITTSSLAGWPADEVTASLSVIIDGWCARRPSRYSTGTVTILRLRDDDDNTLLHNNGLDEISHIRM